MSAVTINNGTTYTIIAVADGQTIRAWIDGNMSSEIVYSSAALNEAEQTHGVYLTEFANVNVESLVMYPRTESSIPGE